MNSLEIPLDLEDSVFQPFFSTKLTKTNTGPGLSICDHIIKAHDGILSCESKPGEWTGFDVLLPRKSRPGTAERL